MQFMQNRPTIPRIPGLPATRRGAVILASACALAAALILVVALNQYRKNVATAGRQDSVLVATGDIQKGTSGELIAAQQLYRVAPVLEQHLAPGALVDAASLRGEVAAHDILPGQQLTAADFIPGSSDVVGQLGPDQRAVSVPVDTAHGLIGLIQVGDRVDVYADFNTQGGAGSPVASTGSNGAPVVKLLIPNALVLKVPQGSGGLSGSSSTSTVSLALSANQVGPLTFASENGKVWLALRPGNASASSQALTTLGSELNDSQSGAQNTTQSLTSTGPGGQ